jgi:hypothetical protein
MRFFTLLALSLILGCAGTQPAPTRGFAETLDLYRASGGKKALALAADENGRKAFAIVHGSWRQKSADEKALATCNEGAARDGVLAQCFLFASGDEEAASTHRGCAAGRIGATRCALQRQYSLGGP